MCDMLIRLETLGNEAAAAAGTIYLIVQGSAARSTLFNFEKGSVLSDLVPFV